MRRSISATAAGGASMLMQRVVRLAVLLDLEGEALEAPVLGLGDLAAAFGDDVGEFLGQRLDLRVEMSWRARKTCS